MLGGGAPLHATIKAFHPFVITAAGSTPTVRASHVHVHTYAVNESGPLTCSASYAAAPI